MTETQIAVRKSDLRLSELMSGANKLMGKKFLLLVGLSTLVLLASSIVPVVLEGALMIGLMICFQHVQDDKQVGLETLLSGFDFFVEGFIARLVLLAAHLFLSLTLIPCYLLLIYGITEQHDAVIAFAALSLCILVIPISVFTLTHSVLTFSLIAQHKLKGVDAVKLAARGILSNPLACAKLGAAVCGIMILGALLCGVGMFVAAPIGYLMIWLAAKELFGVESLAGENVPLAEQG